MRRFVLGGLLAFGVVAGCASSSASDDGTSADQDLRRGGGPKIIASFETPTPAGLKPVLDAIDGAAAQIRMTMFHLTVQDVADHLVTAAKRGVDVQIIVDQGNWNGHTTAALKKQLAVGGVKVIPSSPGFRITHEKSFVVDQKTAYIMSLNLTSPFVDTRDYAVVTTDSAVVSEFLLVWNADAANAAAGTATTPPLTNPSLAWSPINSRDRLKAFVDSAKKTLVVSSENLGDPTIQQAMLDAVGRSVAVRVLAPLCDQNQNVTFDLPFLAQLGQGGVEARAMPLAAGGAPSPDQPYEHAKMMIADGARAFVGSVNFSTASTTNARELGIFFSDAAAIRMISAAFEQDWAKGVPPPRVADAHCPAPPP
jgi:phosphatidylserine/phosphatidylglycerophosphate/cardiolipin synthase-like enzyme